MASPLLPAASTGPGRQAQLTKYITTKTIILYFQEICSYVN